MNGTRRDMLIGLLGAAAGLSACRRSSESRTEPRFEGGYEPDGLGWGHAWRDAPRAPLRRRGADASGGPDFDVVIVGGGMAGLIAGWRLLRAGVDRFVVLEAHEEAGGTSRGGRSAVTPYPWGAHYVPVPGAGQPHLGALLGELGVVEPVESGWIGRETAHVVEPEERSFHRGAWRPGLFPFAGSASREQKARFEREVAKLVRHRDADGRPAFTLPFEASSDAPDLRALDEQTFSEWLDARGFDDPGLRWWLRYASRDDYGTEPEQLSAWYGLAYFAARAHPKTLESAPFVTWPDGNARIVRHLTSVVGERLRTGAVVQRVTPRGGRPVCRVEHRAGGGALGRLTARAVIVAVPSPFRPYLLPTELQGDWRPTYAPWMVSNVHLAGRPAYLGSETAWDNVIVDSDSLGYVVATHQRGSAYGPTVWTHYIPLSGADARAERQKLQSLSWSDAADIVFSDLARAHPDLEQHVDRIDVLRWGHAMVRPEPGARFSTARRRAAHPHDGVHFAHTDLGGAALLEEAVHHGARAADEVIAELRTI